MNENAASALSIADHNSYNMENISDKLASIVLMRSSVYTFNFPLARYWMTSNQSCLEVINSISLNNRVSAAVLGLIVSVFESHTGKYTQLKCKADEFCQEHSHERPSPPLTSHQLWECSHFMRLINEMDVILFFHSSIFSCPSANHSSFFF